MRLAAYFASIASGEARPTTAGGREKSISEVRGPIETFPRAASFRSAPREIAFLESYGVDPTVLARAADLANRQGVGPDAALLDEGFVGERAFYSALADWLGVPYYDGTPAPKPGVHVNAAIASGFATLASSGQGPRAVVAPRGDALRLLVERRAAAEAMPVAIASRQRLSALLRATFGDNVANEAANQLPDREPSLSAKRGATPLQLVVCALALGAAGVGWACAPALVRTVSSIVFWTIFSSAVWLRSLAVAARDASRPGAPHVDAELPMFTVVAALRREAKIVRQLVGAFDALDYPGIM